MMRLLKTNISILALVFSQYALSATTDYEKDKARFYVDGQSLNQALSSVNQIMCFVSNMRADAFVNAGPYKATIYEEDCSTGADSSGDSSAATATSASSSSTASSTSTTTSESKTATTAILNATRLSSVSPVNVLTWVSAPAQDDEGMDMKIYVETKMTGGVTDTSPNGDFVMRFSQHADGSSDLFGNFGGPEGFRDGQNLGQGYLSADGSTLKFKEHSPMGSNNVVATFKANGDKTGIFGEYAGFSTWDFEAYGDPYSSGLLDSPEDFQDYQINIFAYYQYYMSAADKTYCRRLTQADRITSKTEEEIFALEEANIAIFDALWEKNDDLIDEYIALFESGQLTDAQAANLDAAASQDPRWMTWEEIDREARQDPDFTENPWAPNETPIYDLASGLDELSQYEGQEEFSLVVGEECFTTDRAKSQRNVHRYGVYNQDGSRLNMTGGGFPMITFVETTFPDGNTGTIPVHAFADYWGVHVDPRGRSLIDENTIFEKESFDDSAAAAGTVQQYNLRTQDLRVEKRTTSYIALNSIGGLSLAFHFDDWYWRNEFQALFNANDATGATQSTWQKLQALPKTINELEGTFDEETGTFTFTEGISFQTGWEKIDLSTTDVGDISFTIAQWKANMIKEWGKETVTNSVTGVDEIVYQDWYFKDTRNMGVWSHDTRQWYEISESAMSNPTYTTELVNRRTGAATTADDVDAVKAGIRTESTDNISVADLGADLTAASATKLYCIRDCLDAAAVQQTFTDALNPSYQEQYVTTPYADIGEYLKSDVTFYEVDGGYRSLGEATGRFYDTVGTNTNNQIVLGKEFFAITDYLNASENLQFNSRGDGWVETQSCREDYGSATPGAFAVEDNYCMKKLNLYSWDGLNYDNLNKLLEDDPDPANHGIAPSVHFDLKEIPAAGSSGTMKMVVTLYEVLDIQDGYKDTREGAEKSLSAEATLNWSSDGSKFTVTIPPTAETDMILNVGGTAVVGTFGNSSADSYSYGGGAIATGTASDGEGISWKVFRIFAGHHHGLNNLYGTSGIDTFFEADKRYVATIHIYDTDLSIVAEERDWETWNWTTDSGTTSNSDAVKFASLEFRTFDSSTRLREETRLAGEFAEGLQAADMWTYSVSGNSVLDQNGVALSKGTANAAALAQMDNPEQSLQGKRFRNRDGWDQEVAWGIRTGELVLGSDLSKMECRTNGDSGAETYEMHPVYGTSTATKRYCGYKLWEGGVETKYNISMETRPSYEVIYANAVDTAAVVGEAADITEPKVLYYEVPETLGADGTALFGKDAGKRVRLEYAGFGELWGIPGFVFDTATGEDLGEFINEWKETYRYLSRFTMPDGSTIEDATDSTLTYKVKALNGEEWLTKYRCDDESCASVTINGQASTFNPYGTYSASYEGDKSDLVPDRKLRLVGPEDWNGDGIPDNPEYIGDEPTTTSTPAIIENGKTCVVQGEVFCGANAGT